MMKIKHLLLALSTASLLFFSCEFPFARVEACCILGEYCCDPDGIRCDPKEFDCNPNGSGCDPNIVVSRNFWAQNMEDGVFYELTAVLLAEGVHSRIWGETGSNISAQEAKNIADEFDQVLYPRLINAFSPQGGVRDPQTNRNYDNIMHFAGSLINNDNKLNILFLQIRDGFDPPSVNSFVSGYFWSGNFYRNTQLVQSQRFSNENSMIYIDIKQNTPGSLESNMVIAHEMQHLMNFAFSVLTERSPGMDLWINEGLSAAAEWVYSGEYSQNRINDFNNDPSGLILQGNNFFVWDNHKSNPLAIIDDYSTVYIFFQWIRLLEGRSEIYRDIIASEYSDYRAVLNAMTDWDAGWAELMVYWLMANYFNLDTGPFGYQGEPRLRDIATGYMSGSTAVLFPQEGVYSRVVQAGQIPSPSNDAPFITYIDLQNGTLLTFNANQNRTGSAETGVLASTGIAAGSKSVQDVSTAVYGPFAVGAQDVLARNGYEIHEPARE